MTRKAKMRREQGVRFFGRTVVAVAGITATGFALDRYFTNQDRMAIAQRLGDLPEVKGSPDFEIGMGMTNGLRERSVIKPGTKASISKSIARLTAGAEELVTPVPEPSHERAFHDGVRGPKEALLASSAAPLVETRDEPVLANVEEPDLQAGNGIEAQPSPLPLVAVKEEAITNAEMLLPPPIKPATMTENVAAVFGADKSSETIAEIAAASPTGVPSASLAEDATMIEQASAPEASRIVASVQAGARDDEPARDRPAKVMDDTASDATRTSANPPVNALASSQRPNRASFKPSLDATSDLKVNAPEQTERVPSEQSVSKSSLTASLNHPSDLPYLGALVSPGSLTIARIVADSPAYEGGLQVGDEVQAFDGVSLTKSIELARVFRSKVAGDLVMLEVMRDGQVVQLDVRLGSAPR